MRYSSAVFYRLLRFINEWYAIAVLWIFIAAFLMALGFMFIFPQVTLAMFFIGLCTLGVAAVASGVLQSTMRLAARRQLGRGICPGCGAAVNAISHPQATLQCSNCRTLFTATGSVVEQAPSTETPNALDEDRIQ